MRSGRVVPRVCGSWWPDTVVYERVEGLSACADSGGHPLKRHGHHIDLSAITAIVPHRAVGEGPSPPRFRLRRAVGRDASPFVDSLVLPCQRWKRRAGNPQRWGLLHHARILPRMGCEGVKAASIFRGSWASRTVRPPAGTLHLSSTITCYRVSAGEGASEIRSGRVVPSACGSWWPDTAVYERVEGLSQHVRILTGIR